MWLKQFILFAFLVGSGSVVAETVIKGWVVDKKTGEPVVGAAVVIVNTTIGVATDGEGRFTISNLKAGKYDLKFSCLSYSTLMIKEVMAGEGEETELKVELEEEAVAMEEVSVRAVRRVNNEAAVLHTLKVTPVVMNAVSSQMISRTQDRDAGEVVRRLPGVSVIGDRFVVLRGLAQRYNNVWINHMPAPSSESDQRAFSFDVIPGSVIENILILKTTSPEYPADYAGGFIHLKTKSSVEEDQYAFSVGTGFETGTTFRSFKKNPAGTGAFWGFNDGTLSLPASARKDFTALDPDRDYKKLEKIARDFNPEWEPRSGRAYPDMRLAFSMNKKVYSGENTHISTVTSVNFSHANAIQDKKVNLWGMFDERYGKPLPLSLNEQTIYKESGKLSVLHNWMFSLNTSSQLEFRNFFNNISSNRVIDRYQDKKPNKFKGTELSFMQRMTYTGQFSGVHFRNTGDKKLDWTIGYSYAGKTEPDQKQYDFYQDNEGKYYLPVMTTPDINRISNKLGEHVISGAVNFNKKFTLKNFQAELKTGLYTEYKTRDFNTRWFIYLPVYPGNLAFYEQGINEIMNGNYFKDEEGGIRIQELTERSDSYDAENKLLAAYFSVQLPLTSWLTLSGGVRGENNNRCLNGFRQSTGSQEVPLQVENKQFSLFPSALMTFQLLPGHQLRLAYSSSVNRPEFREIAPYVFYDFENDVTIHGNVNLKDCRIKGMDLRYEWYPSVAENISLAFFYKDFKDMIELVQMGSLYPVTYKYENVPNGKSYGIELDIRKNLAREGCLKNFSLILNASWVKSVVNYSTGYENRKREMQGQSPYIVNAGLFFQSEKIGLSVSSLYNVTGKRILINGDYSSVTAEAPDAYIPDTYEMPRHGLDLNITQKIGNRLEIKWNAKDLINNTEEMRQTYNNGYVAYREKSASGRKFFVSLGMKF